jgi:hypothetical protein
MLRLPRDSEREETKGRGLALHLLTTYTRATAPVNTNPQQGRVRESRKSVPFDAPDSPLSGQL